MALEIMEFASLILAIILHLLSRQTSKTPTNKLTIVLAYTMTLSKKVGALVRYGTDGRIDKNSKTN